MITIQQVIEFVQRAHTVIRWRHYIVKDVILQVNLQHETPLSFLPQDSICQHLLLFKVTILKSKFFFLFWKPEILRRDRSDSERKTKDAGQLKNVAVGSFKCFSHLWQISLRKIDEATATVVRVILMQVYFFILLTDRSVNTAISPVLFPCCAPLLKFPLIICL